MERAPHVGRSILETDLSENLESHDFHDLSRSEIRFKKDFSLSAALPRNV